MVMVIVMVITVSRDEGGGTTKNTDVYIHTHIYMFFSLIADPFDFERA